MTGVSERIRGWLGWCPDARVLTTAPPDFSVPPLGNPAMLPDGGPWGSWRIRRGKDIAAESMKILVRNRRLLWISFLMFLTFILSIGTDQILRDIFRINAFPGVLSYPVILGAALTFAAAFMETFVFFFLAAGLILCVSQIPTGNSMRIREGLSRAWSHTRSLAGWALIGALLWISVGAFTIGFYFVTLFALPAMVLDNKNLASAIRESIAIFRSIWVETYVSFGIILLITIGCILVMLFSLGQAALASGLLNEGIPAGFISLVVSVIMAIGLVVMGIATCILYTYEKTGFFLDR